MRRAPRLAGAEVIDRRQLMPGVFNPDMAHKAADGFQPGIALRDRRSARRPINCGLRVDMCLPALGRKGGKALEQVFRIQHRESSGTPWRSISVAAVCRRTCAPLTGATMPARCMRRFTTDETPSPLRNGRNGAILRRIT